MLGNLYLFQSNPAVFVSIRLRRARFPSQHRELPGRATTRVVGPLRFAQPCLSLAETQSDLEVHAWNDLMAVSLPARVERARRPIAMAITIRNLIRVTVVRTQTGLGHPHKKRWLFGKIGRGQVEVISIIMSYVLGCGSQPCDDIPWSFGNKTSSRIGNLNETTT